MPELATLTGARAGHTNGWHGPQAGSRLRLGWQALVDCRFRTTWGFGGGCGCKLLGWEVVLFKPKGCGVFVLFLVVNCAVCCANFCDQIIREVVHFLCFFVDEVVRFVLLIFVIKSSGKLCTFCAFLLMKLWSVPNIKSIRCFYFSLACCCAKMIREVVHFKPKRCGFCCAFSCG